MQFIKLEYDGTIQRKHYLQPPSQAQHQMQRALFLNVVVRQTTTVLQLLPREDQALLIRRNAFLILDLLFHPIDRVGWFCFQGDGLASQGQAMIYIYIYHCLIACWGVLSNPN
jgi:hypothetical protein